MADEIEITFTLNGDPLRLKVLPGERLLDTLRERLRLTGAKEGCGKGECGACTVIMEGQAIDACLTLAYQADGAAIETIEGLAGPEGLHPLQDAFIETGGVQCGICIPGMVLAAKAALDETQEDRSFQGLRRALAGNLCRCTGYTKIVEAVARAAAHHPPARRAATGPGAAPAYYRPRTLEEALEILAQRAGEVAPLAGGTDLLVAAKDGRVDPAALFDITGIPELKALTERPDGLWIGAGCTHTELLRSPLVRRLAPALSEACEVIGGPQIRNRGTLGGNLAHASPAADTLPALYVADAVVELVSVSERRDVPVTSFVVGPGKTVLQPDELILGVRIPVRPNPRGAFLRLGQRQAQAISKVSLAVSLTLSDGRPDWVRVALGAVGPTVIRALDAEAALMRGGRAGLEKACVAVREAARPISDMRSTSEYRRAMTAVLLERAVTRLTGS